MDGGKTTLRGAIAVLDYHHGDSLNHVAATFGERVQPIHFGISTCPNDTFLFHPIMTGKVDPRGLDLRIDLMDVQELNRRLAVGEFDAAKGSFHAALRLSRELGVLPVGAALGYGVGPLLLAANREDSPALLRPDGSPARVLAPGDWTTATLLYELFHRGEGEVAQVVFDQIMPALKKGEADFGVCIHEGRFTYEREGLHRVEDLGVRWEAATGVPLPLGGLFARHSLGGDVHRRLAATLRDAYDYATSHREETLPTLRRYARELDDDVIWAHVDLYVNRWTRALGDEGKQALLVLARLAAEREIVSDKSVPLQVIGEES